MRGQPPRIGPERYGEVLDLLRSGLSMVAVAERLNIPRSTLYNLPVRDRQMGEAMRAAREVGKAARAAAHEPSESCYVRGCRTTACTAAATQARAERRATATAAAAPVAVLPAGDRLTVYELLADDGPPLASSA